MSGDDKTLILEVDYDDEDYRWHVFGVFQGADGRLYTATDGGCSCNYAWDTPPDLTPVASLAEAEVQARAEAGGFQPDIEKVERTFREFRNATSGSAASQ